MWILIDPTPSKCPIMMKWVVKHKPIFNNAGMKFKVQLVTHGFQQQKDLDYHKIFAPTMKWGTLWLITSIVTHKDWPILHLNVQTAFLNGFLFEEVHMEQLVIFVELGAKHKVCLFKCALYTLNQSPHACIVVSLNSYDDKISSKMLKLQFLLLCSII